ncbi:hypothetical protein TRICI_004590 [Trichomonascus ciferrii]|uniref:Uncharacterized protein n=1 Tax=Trichomonascus ciferrii TaxID=44093 RepID=A0A642V011_9ASCO|nr:hypothetical protein TRICI_004590 [Trichomonascus ciferrii]
MQSARQIERVPLGEVGEESVDVDNAVLDPKAVDLDERIEVDARAHVVLDKTHRAGAQMTQRGVVVRILLHVERVPVLGVRHAEDQVDLGVGPVAGGALAEHAAAIGKCVAYGSMELPQCCTQVFSQLVVYGDVLVASKVLRKVGELLDVPIRAHVQIQYTVFVLFNGASQSHGGAGGWPPAKPSPDVRGGLAETVKAVAKYGTPLVIFTGRKQEIIQETIRNIEKNVMNTAMNGVVMDLAPFEAIKQSVSEIKPLVDHPVVGL